MEDKIAQVNKTNFAIEGQNAKLEKEVKELTRTITLLLLPMIPGILLIITLIFSK